jgi:hypothetical protein
MIKRENQLPLLYIHVRLKILLHKNFNIVYLNHVISPEKIIYVVLNLPGSQLIFHKLNILKLNKYNNIFFTTFTVPNFKKSLPS